MSALKLGVPSKGRLQDQTIEYFAAAGITIKKTGAAREYAARLTGVADVEVALIQAGEAPAKLAAGELHLAVTGEDLIRERLDDWESQVALLKPMGFGQADLVVAVPNFWLDVTDMADLEEAAAAFRECYGRPMRAATKYFRLTRAFFAAHGVTAYRIVESLGATEGTPAAETAEFIVDITTSGETLRANNLKILEDGPILRSQATLCASRKAPWSGAARQALAALADRLSAREAAAGRTALLGGGEVALAAKADLTESVARLRAAGAAQVEAHAPDLIFGPQDPKVAEFLERLPAV